MNAIDAVAFLRQHQPFPDDIRPELGKRLGIALSILYREPLPEAIPLLVHCFGDWEDLTLAEYIRSVLSQYPVESVWPHLQSGLESENRNIRFAAADLVASFPHPDFIPSLAKVIREPHPLNRLVAAIALERIGGEAVTEVAVEGLATEPDEEVCDVLIAILGRAAKEGQGYFGRC